MSRKSLVILGLFATTIALGCGDNIEEVPRSCVELARADWIVEADQPLPQSTIVRPPFGNDQCVDSAVFELELTSTNSAPLYYTRVWPSGTFKEDQEACESAKYSVSVFRGLEESSGAIEWESTPFDEYVFVGQWDAGLCNSSGAGRIGPDEQNTLVGYPVNWVDTSPVGGRNVKRVRVIVSPVSHRGIEPVVFQFQGQP